MQKFTQQIMAASEAGRSLAYHTFGDETTAAQIQKEIETILHNNCTVGDLWKSLK
jgi:hypothetical protein